MNKIIYNVLICGILLCTTACRKYVEVLPVQSRVLRYTADYQALLQSTTTFDNSYYSPIFAGDDVGSTDTRWQNAMQPAAANAFIWAPAIYGSEEEDLDWGTMYKQIFVCNTVIAGIDGSENGTAAQKQKAMSYALVQRAYNYYVLINIYGKQYDAATAAGDPGVPLVLEPKFFTDLTRASVQKVYDQIKSDLTTSLPGLTDLPDFNPNPSKVAVYALMSRVNLNTRDFAEADRYAALALSLQNKLLDLNAYITTPASIPIRTLNPEEIFFKKTNNFPVTYPLSPDALSMFDEKDLRYTLFTINGATMAGSNFTTRAYWRYKILSDGNYVGPNVPEMLLIRAECAARANNPSGAVGFLNVLRAKRFKPADYRDLAAADGNAALHLVVDERKREFVGRGFRWFDQRRLSKDPGFVTTVTRTFKGNTFMLEPGSNGYTYPIAEKYIRLNPEITQNPR